MYRQSADICVIASSALFIYDCILCLGREYQYVWRSGKSRVSRLLFLYIRYTTLLPSILAFWTITPLTDTVSTGLVSLACEFMHARADGRVLHAEVIIPSYWSLTHNPFDTMASKLYSNRLDFYLPGDPRVHRACRGHDAQNLCFVRKEGAIERRRVHPGPRPISRECEHGIPSPTCQSSSSPELWTRVHGKHGYESRAMTICARCCAILADVIAIVVTWRATRTCRRLLGDGSFQQASLQHIMWTNGNIYFFTLLSINILDLILVTLSIIVQNSAGSYVILFLDPISAILNCHFLLDLYEANVRIERGGSSLSRSHPTLSLRFVAGSESEARGAADAEGPSGDLALFSAFAGPLYTFQDTDTEFDLVNGELELVVTVMFVGDLEADMGDVVTRRALDTYCQWYYVRGVWRMKRLHMTRALPMSNIDGTQPRHDHRVPLAPSAARAADRHSLHCILLANIQSTYCRCHLKPHRRVRIDESLCGRERVEVE
ncbi:hypothetical protein BC628DRAFT_445168 [Trametes gibbosa]|nr:hypothetical protein BC628DRAFT_445168 [Trametes gibbosa]